MAIAAPRAKGGAWGGSRDFSGIADAGIAAPQRATLKAGGTMRHYAGDRTIDGVKVTVDGVPLDPRVNIVEFSKNGFEWSYEGPEPRQLALALLADHLGDDAAAKAQVEPFMRAIVANFGNEWEMSSADIDVALAGLAGKAVA
jgi:hypothetical protein